MDWTGFRPDIAPEHEPFWNSVRRHRVELQRCDGCGTFRYIPAELCHRCWSSAATWTPVAGVGEVYTWTVVRRAPTPGYQAMAPYVIAHVTLPEGPRMISHLVVDDPAQADVGLRVEIFYTDVDDDFTLFRFRPV